MTAVSPSPSTIRIEAITSSRPKMCRGSLYPYNRGEQHYEYERRHRWHRKDGPACCPQPAGTWLYRLWVSSSHDRRFHYHGGSFGLIKKRIRTTLRYRLDMPTYCRSSTVGNRGRNGPGLGCPSGPNCG